VARLFLSATHKSSGKTMISIGLAAALTRQGLRVQTFKKGPDYIDPMWLGRASGRPCYNLDFNTQTRDEIVSTFARNARNADVALIEGNKGLHDGVDVEGSDSSAALAKVLSAPIVLVVDAFGMARGVAPLVKGYAAFDRRARIAGVILNKVGTERQTAKLRQALERYTDIPVLGAVGRDEGIVVRERHLGLTTPGETARSVAIIEAARDAVVRNVDLDRVRAIASRAPAVRARLARIARPRALDTRIAVARDNAFGFYYEDDFEAFERAGARLVFFDALRDERLPACDGLFIGGGFPETHAAKLAANASMRESIRNEVANGLPTYAECGGLMYLSRSIVWGDERHPMVGAIPADARMHDRPQGRGLVILEETGRAPWRVGSGAFPAHEFHYASLEGLAAGSEFAYRVRRGEGVDGHHDGVVIGSLIASFSHLRDTESHPWVARFVEFARQKRAGASALPPGAAAFEAPNARARAMATNQLGRG
jgi:cobyrinic acid a,c-diamide synthase